MATETYTKVGGTWEFCETVYTKVSGTWKPCTHIYTKVAGAWKLVHRGLNANVSPTSLNPVDTQTSASCTCTAANGRSPYTYSWQRVSGDTEVTANTPTASVTTFNNSENGVTHNAVFKCVVTDNHGTVVNSLSNVTINFTYT